MFWHDAPVASPRALLAACCGIAPHAGQVTGFSQSLRAGRIVRAGDAVALLEVRPGPNAAASWERLERERLHVKFRACFCSVFDECWTSTLVGTRAARVASCPAPQVPFGVAGAEDLER